MTYLVTYSLRNKNKDYSAFYDAINSCGEVLQILDAAWVISTQEMNATAITDVLHANMDPVDSLIVIKMDQCERNGWLPKSHWTWIGGHVEGPCR